MKKRKKGGGEKGGEGERRGKGKERKGGGRKKKEREWGIIQQYDRYG